MLAPRRDGDRFWYPLARHPVARVLKFRNFQRYLRDIPRGGVVVDYGSGDRPYEELLLTRFDRYIAADYEVTNLGHARRPDVAIRDGRVDLPGGSVTCVVLTEVLEHCSDPRATLAECWRLLAPGGFVAGSVPFARGEHEAPYDFFRYTSFGLRHLLADARFEILEVEYVGDLSAVAATTLGETLGLGAALLRRLRIGWLADAWMLAARLPEFAWFALHSTPLDPQRLAALRRYPLGFTFLARKPASAA